MNNLVADLKSKETSTQLNGKYNVFQNYILFFASYSQFVCRIDKYTVSITLKARNEKPSIYLNIHDLSIAHFIKPYRDPVHL